jgi:hypothetical protein
MERWCRLVAAYRLRRGWFAGIAAQQPVPRTGALWPGSMPMCGFGGPVGHCWVLTMFRNFTRRQPSASARKFASPSTAVISQVGHELLRCMAITLSATMRVTMTRRRGAHRAGSGVKQGNQRIARCPWCRAVRRGVSTLFFLALLST